MAVQTITTSVNADAIASGAWRSNDTLTINNGAVVTVNTDQGKFWSGITINNGKLRIENNSTTTGIHFRMGRVSGVAAANITPANGLGSVEFAGNWIEIGTSNGTADQVFTVPYRDSVAAVWVETASGSGVYESWANAAEPYGVVPKQELTGLKAFGSGRRGMVFIQVPNTNQHQVFVKTNCTTVNTSRTITLDSTTDITPGSWISGTGIPANSVVEKVLSSTQVEMNAAATANSSTVTLTIYPTLESQLNNQIKFGNNTDGAIPPDGCKIRVPNIMFTHVCGTNIGGNFGTYAYIVLTNSGSLTVDTALFDCAVGTYTGAEILSLKRLGMSCAPTLSKVYGLDIDDCVVAVRPFRHWWSTTLPVLELSAGGYANANYWGISYLTGNINKLYIAALRPTYSATVGNAVLRIDYADQLTISKLRIVYAHGFAASTGFTSLGLVYVNNSTISDAELYGPAPISFTTSSGNTVTDLTFGYGVFNYGMATGVFLNGTCSLKYDPSTGDPLVDNTRYFLKPYYPNIKNRFTDIYTEWQEYSGIPHVMPTYGVPKVNIVGNNSGAVLNWTRLDPTHNSPAYEIFRSTDPAVPTRDAGTRVFTTNTVTTATATDSTGFTGTTYYYVLRKYSSAGVYVDTPVLKAVAKSTPTITNYCLQSSDPSNASWTKTNITVAAAGWPGTLDAFGYYVLTRRALTVTVSGGSISQTVAGLSIGVTYTASMTLYRVPTNASGVVTSTAACVISFGTATDTFTLTTEPTTRSFTFTATATSHVFSLTVNTLNAVIAWEVAGIINSSVNYYPPGTTTAAATSGVSYFSNIGMLAYKRAGETTNQGLLITGATGLTLGVFSLGTTSDFTTSKSNLALMNNTLTCETFRFTTSSNNNVINGVTQVGFGSSNGRFAVMTASCSDNIIKNATVTLASGQYAGTTFYSVFDVQLDSNRNNFKNITINGNLPQFAYQPLIYTQNTANDSVFENIKTTFSGTPIYAYNNNTSIKGVGGANASIPDGAATAPIWNIGSTTDGMPSAFTAIFGSIFAETYHTSTTGALHILFTASTETVKPYTLSGLAKFSNTGRLYLQQANDSITYTWPHKIYGVSGFRSLLPKVYCEQLNQAAANADIPQAVLIEVQINTGSGYGSWVEATASNLAALSVSATTGFYLKVRLTARAFFNYSGQTNNFVIGETIRQLTSGATARVVADYDFGTTGCCIIDTITGTWAATTTYDIVRDSDSQIRCTDIALVNTSFALGPSFNSFISGLQLWTTVDQTVLYPADLTTITFTGLPTGCDVVILTAGTNTVLHQVDQNSGTTFAWSYAGTPTVDVGFINPGYTPYYIRNLALTLTNSSIPVSLTADRNYL